MDLLAGLNPAQRQAVEAVNGPLLVIAGPGSGKTRVIVHRIAYLARVCGVRPRRIMAVTFTNKAAHEMRERVQRLLGQPAAELALGTFHALGARLLRIEAEAAGLDRNFVIYDEQDQIALVKRAMEDTQVDPKRFGPPAVRHQISAAKAKLLTPAEFAMTRASYFDEVVLRVYERYETLLHMANAADFDDLIMRVVRLLESNAELRDRYQSRYVHVLIDEFQDTNLGQYKMARLIAAGHRNLCVVGDPDQSIYSWRYADLGNILNFEKDYPEAQVVTLEQNYRSTQTILHAAGRVIALNRARKDKALWTENQKGARITVHEAGNEQDEALFVVDEVERLVRKESRRYGDCAILYRTNAQSRPLEEAFVRYGLPYRLVGATRFYERREVKDLLAYLRLVLNPLDDVNLLRIVNVPSRGIGQRTLDELARWAGAQGIPLYTALQLLDQPGEAEAHPDRPGRPEVNPRALRSLAAFRALIDELAQEARTRTVPELIDHVLARTGYRDHLQASDDRGDERLENVMELRTVAEEQARLGPASLSGSSSPLSSGEGEYPDTPGWEGEETTPLAAFLENVALVSDTDDLEARASATTLITLHQAKGLEFPIVFMIGMEEGLLPHVRSFEDPAQMEEERRLCYVGMTRAQERLYLVRAYRRAAMGMRAANPPSRFLADVPSDLVATPGRRPAPASRGGDAWAGAAFRPKAATGTPTPMASRFEQAQRTAPAPSPYRAGDRVKHRVFGEGVVVACAPNGADQEITVAFPGQTGVKRLLLAYAPLEKV